MLSLLVTSYCSSTANTKRLKQQRFRFLPAWFLVWLLFPAWIPLLFVSLCGLMPVGTEGG